MEEGLITGSKQANLIYPLKHSLNQSREYGCIYLGSRESAMDKEFLRENGIRAILTVAPDMQICPGDEIAHVIIEAHDNTIYNIRDDFDSAYDFIDKQLQLTNVLIHCEQGVSRSPTIAIAYIMRKEKRILSDVLHQVKLKRQEIEPNGGFIYYLDRYCDHLKQVYKQEFDQNYAQKFIQLDSPSPINLSSRLKEQRMKQSLNLQ